MRPIVARAVTAAFATAGVAWAIALPSLTLGEPKSPARVFALPAAGGDIVIEASAPAPPASRRSAPAAAHRKTAARPTPARGVIHVAPTQPTHPRLRLHRRARVTRPLAEPAPRVLAPKATPNAPRAPERPAEPAVRTLASAPVQRAAENTERKHHKGKARKEKKPKQKQVLEEAVDASAVAEPAQELEPAPLDDPESTGPEPDAGPEDNHGKTHGGHGKGHEKKN